ncbi:MAG TPA: DNA gyrase inhibitor YacG [Kofleriaceae bacterium]|nr:DNA gyrase inhibitor YacG [Kofleriaceae bacterium]
MGTARKSAPSTCPICGKPAVPGAVVNAKGGDAFPFCSFRCQLIDLGRWLGEEYRVPDGDDQSGGGVDGAPAPGDDRSET